MPRSPAIIGITGSTARVKIVWAKTTRATIFRSGVMAGLVWSSGLALAVLVLCEPVERDQPAQQRFHLLERHHVRSVGRRLFGILMGLDEHACDPDCDRTWCRSSRWKRC